MKLNINNDPFSDLDCLIEDAQRMLSNLQELCHFKNSAASAHELSMHAKDIGISTERMYIEGYIHALKQLAR